jgi:hypothetical protein
VAVTFKANADGVSGAIQVNGVDSFQFDATGIVGGVKAESLPATVVSVDSEQTLENKTLVGAVLNNPQIVVGGGTGGAGQALVADGSGGSSWTTVETTVDAVFAVGDVITTAKELSEPEWLPADGSVRMQAGYPELFAEVGLLADLENGATKLTNPAVLLSNYALGCAFSPDSAYLAVGHYNAPFITIYKRSGDTFTKLADPLALPTNYANGCAFSPDGTYLAVAHQGTPYITIYKRSGDTFTKLTNPAVLPAGNGYGCAFSPDGTYLAVAHSVSPFITIYKRDYDHNLMFKFTNYHLAPPGNAKVYVKAS